MTLTTRVETWIAEQVHGGVDERTAVKAIEDALEEVKTRQAIVRAREEVKAGKTIPADDAFFARIKEEIIREVHNRQVHNG